MTASTDPAPRTSAPESSSISVIVPTFNDVARLSDALRGIVGQTLPPFEVVVSDDGSDDGTEQFVGEFAAREANGVEVRYVRLSARSGVVAARNRGIAESRGAWIACCDSDDVWAPSKLERQAAFIRDWKGSRRIALLGTHGYNMNDAKKVISPAIMGPTSQEDYEAIRQAGRIFFVIHSSVMYSRADFLAVGGYSTEYGAADDFHFFCKMAELGVVLNLPEPLVYYRKRAGSVQLARFWDQQQGLLRLTENQRRRAGGEAPIGSQEFAATLASASLRRRLKRGRRVRGMYYYRLGATDMVNGRRLRGAWKLALAAVMDGGRLRSGVRGALRAASRRSRPALRGLGKST
jgi:glycosyltransferase involved in cell wall biosynthesis